MLASPKWRLSRVLTVLAMAGFTGAPANATSTSVLTYHYDTLRTGWNQTETALTPSAVASSQFGLLQRVSLDEQVDAQPLLVTGVQIGGATHDVLYVATENDTIYAIDAESGSVLLSQNYGTPVPESALPGQCNNNAYVVGINSTPVIDKSTGTLYAITYTYENNTPTFRLHAINIATLADNTPPPVIGGSANLRNGKPIGFVSANNRQRAALLESGGNIYAGFGGWCDIDGTNTRGWILGWNASTLDPLPLSKLTNRRTESRSQFFLSTIWMSGYGISADTEGNIYFATGNSDPGGASYNPTYNLSESVIKMSSDLSTVESFFTPKGGSYGWSSDDKYDNDFGAGGVLLLPDQLGGTPHMAVAAGKVGPMYLLNRDMLGGLGTKKVTLGAYENDGCWCGQSYYTGSDGVGRVVESAGVNAIVWKVETSPKPRLVKESESPSLNDMQDPGFFTTVSSNGTAAGSAVIWAVERPSDPNTDYISLVAFDPGKGSAQIYSDVAGIWYSADRADADIVPVVANGYVYVASGYGMSIFGLSSPGHPKLRFTPPAHPPMNQALPPGTHEVRGVITAISATELHLRLRDGRMMSVDIRDAAAKSRMVPPAIGHAVVARGTYVSGTFTATSILHQKSNVLTWEPDR